MATVYLLHFDRPYWAGKNHPARHYCGYTKNGLEARLEKHRNGTGSRLVKYALKHGATFQVAWSVEMATPWEARQLELQLKATRNLPKICPVCQKEKRL